MTTEPLHHLTEQSAGVGTWMVKVAMEPCDLTYSWTKNNKTNNGRKLEFVLVSDDATKYCQGLYQRRGKEPKATEDFEAAKRKFHKGTIWKVSKVSLAKQNPKYMGCSCKISIDMNTSKFEPVLQSTINMPMQAAPPEDLATLLECHEDQVVDVVALVKKVSEPVTITTAYGDRLKVDVTIMDDSGANSAAISEFAAWFPKSRNEQHGADDQLQKLLNSVTSRKPVAFFNLRAQKSAGSASEHASNSKTSLTTSREKFSFEVCNEGTKASRLATNAATILSVDSSHVTVVAELPTFMKQEVDYRSIDSTLTVCQLLRYVIEAGPAGLPDGSDKPILFQINHARIIEPKARENHFTKDDRLFPAVRVVDSTGTLELRMREKTALSLAGANDKAEFAELASDGALNFPILTSLRVVLQSTKNEDSASEHADNRFSAVIVEAVEQDLLSHKVVPNMSMEYLSQLMLSLPVDSNRMLVAPISAVRLVRHTGLAVLTSSSVSQKASCVLSLIAHLGRSVISDLAGGHKLVSKHCWNVPFEAPSETEDGAPEHTNKKVSGELASYCTMSNVQDFTLTNRKPKEPVYALIIISNVHLNDSSNENLTYMVDKVGMLRNSDEVPLIRCLLRKLAQTTCSSSRSAPTKQTPDWQNQTPYSAKKARRLCDTPTDAPLPSP